MAHRSTHALMRKPTIPISSRYVKLYAAARDLEGFVIVADSSNALFERYAIEAAYKFKYKPRYIDGEPVESGGVLHKFTFVLEN